MQPKRAGTLIDPTIADAVAARLYPDLPAIAKQACIPRISEFVVAELVRRRERIEEQSAISGVSPTCPEALRKM